MIIFVLAGVIFLFLPYITDNLFLYVNVMTFMHVYSQLNEKMHCILWICTVKPVKDMHMQPPLGQYNCMAFTERRLHYRARYVYMDCMQCFSAMLALV